MRFHDAYARLTPLELAFPEVEGARAWADEVFQEAAELREDPSDPGVFMTLASVGARLKQLGSDASGPALFEYVTLAFHFYHFERAGRPFYLVDTPAARWLVRTERVEGSPEPPLPAAYVQLPRRLFWTRDEPPEPAEAVDGMFWTVSGSGLLHVLLVTGMWDERPGLGVAPLAAAPLMEARTWLSATLRDEGPDYASTLPGGEMEELYSFTNAGEVLKLAARLFAHLNAHPEAVVRGETPPRHAVPAPSALAYRRITVPESVATDA